MLGIPAPLVVMPSVRACLTKFLTSSFKIRPLRPLPIFILLTFTPSSRAKSRTEGEAWAFIALLSEGCRVFEACFGVGSD